MAGGILVRLFLLQIFKGSFYYALAQNQQQIFEQLVPQRGEIFIQDKFQKTEISVDLNNDNLFKNTSNLFPVAANKEYQMVYVVSKEVEEKDRDLVAKKLAEIIGQQEEKIKEKIYKTDDPYEPIAHKLSDEQAQKIKELKIKGIYLSPETWRYYPSGNFLSHVLGFVGFYNDTKIGQYGLEGFYQKELEGKPGLIDAVKDAIGRWIFSSEYNLEPARNGDNLILTIDQNIQFMAEKELKEVGEKWQAESGTAIIMDPTTGKVLAMANFPGFDPNEYSKVENIDVFVNPAIQKLYEPGSVMKPITMAAGLDSGKIEPETTYTDTGLLQIGGYTISNAAERKYGLCTMTKVLEKSINTGAVFAQRKVGTDLFREYIEKFGFGETTGIDLYGEISGNINGLKSGSPEINFATASFGQGIAVTPMELITALSAIANQGKLMKPYLVEKIIYADGSEEKIEPQMKRQVISPEAAKKLTSMLVSTVRNGYDKIKLTGYFVAGKTGTAQIPNQDKRGYSSDSIHTFVGWAPAFDPKFIILLKMDKPKGINFASDSLSPPFTNLTKYLLNYYEIPPEE
jgi:cell division protein FtsI/penicillin-binding protein 2